MRQRNYNNWFLPDRENESAHDLDSLRTITNDDHTKSSPQTDDTKHRHFDAVV